MKVASKSRVVAGVLLWALGGCAGGPGASDSMTERKASILVEAVLQDIDDIYYRETKASELVAAGLGHVQASYPGVGFAREEAAIIASVGDQTVFRFDVGKDKGAAGYWADGVAAILAHVERAYAGDGNVDLAALTDTFLEGTADSLDGRTAYATPAMVRLSNNQSKGGQGTLKLILLPDEAGWQVERAVGLNAGNSLLVRKGDVILAIDGTATRGLSEAEMLKLIQGPVGTPATLAIQRPGNSAPLTVTLNREDRNATSVGVYPEGSILRITLTHLDSRSLNELRAVLAEKASGPSPDYQSIILDLRSNPGGLLESSIAIADIFLAEGRLFSTRGRHEDSHQKFNAGKNAPTNLLPLVVLVDETTGSGAEFAVAALQDSGRAVVVGQTTFGAGTLQTLLPLPNGGAFKLTWVEVLTASGYLLEKRGVLPTVCTGSNVMAEALLAELGSGGGVIDYATRARDIEPEDAAALKAHRALCPPRSDGADVDVDVAQALLEDPVLFARVLAAAGP